MNPNERAPLRALAACKSCGQGIVWAVTTKGKAIPLNPSPNERGNLMLTRTGDGKLVALYANPGDAQTEPRYTSHFANCPGAHNFRAPRKRSGAMRQP